MAVRRMKAPLMDYEIARARMVKEQCIARGITDENVLRAMGTMPRHLFVDAGFELADHIGIAL